jgi:polyisoprenoid-binding protein YceI
MMATATLPKIVGYRAGLWKIDPTHSEVSFTMRHTLVHLRGRFSRLSGVIATADELPDSHVTVEIDAASFWTGSEVRDEKIRFLSDFLEARRFPAILFRSTRLRPLGDERGFFLDGFLTVRGTERPVTLDARFNGFGNCALYGTRVGFSATTTLDRRDFGIATEPPPIAATLPLEDGPSMLGWTLKVDIQVEAVLDGVEGKYRW